MAAKPHAALRKKLLAYALSLPEAEEHHPWGEDVAKVGGKIFFFGGKPENDLLAGLKLPLSRSAALRLPGAEPMGYGMGAHDWVTIWGAAARKVDLDLMRVWILESYRAVAPKRIAARLDPPAPGAAVRPSGRTPTRRSSPARRAASDRAAGRSGAGPSSRSPSR